MIRGGEYAESFWLPVLGPTCLWLLRACAYGFDEGEGFTVPWSDMAAAIGLQAGSGSCAPLRKSLERLVRFGLAERIDGQRYAVRDRLPWVPRQLARTWPVSRQRAHPLWEDAADAADAEHAAGRRAWRYTVEQHALGMSVDELRAQLDRRCDDPALRAELIGWAQTTRRYSRQCLTMS